MNDRISRKVVINWHGISFFPDSSLRRTGVELAPLQRGLAIDHVGAIVVAMKYGYVH
jgi:hypothetical protein